MTSIDETDLIGLSWNDTGGVDTMGGKMAVSPQGAVRGRGGWGFVSEFGEPSLPGWTKGVVYGLALLALGGCAVGQAVDTNNNLSSPTPGPQFTPDSPSTHMAPPPVSGPDMTATAAVGTAEAISGAKAAFLVDKAVLAGVDTQGFEAAVRSALDVGEVIRLDRLRVGLVDPVDQDIIVTVGGKVGPAENSQVSNDVLVACGASPTDTQASCVVFSATEAKTQFNESGSGARITKDVPLAITPGGGVIPQEQLNAQVAFDYNQTETVGGNRLPVAESLQSVSFTDPDGKTVVVGADVANPGGLWEQAQNLWKKLFPGVQTVQAQAEMTATPALSAVDIARNLGLYTEGRQYVETVIDGTTFLVDQYNQSRVLVRENETWVASSPEQRYGFMVPVDGDYSLRVTKSTEGDVYYSSYGYFTGDTSTGTFKFEKGGVDLETMTLRFVTRNSKGELKIANITYDESFRDRGAVRVSLLSQDGFISGEIIPYGKSLPAVLEIFEQNEHSLVGKPVLMTFPDFDMDKMDKNATTGPQCDLNDTSDYGIGVCFFHIRHQALKQGLVVNGQALKSRLEESGYIGSFDTQVYFQILLKDLSREDAEKIKQEINEISSN